ncbi:histone-lysine N-methyltransferase 2C-like, partial [Saccoglossus kowalevskii]
MSGRKKKFPRTKPDPDYVAETGDGSSPGSGIVNIRRGRGRPRKDGTLPVPRKKIPHPMLRERYPGDDDNNVVMATDAACSSRESVVSDVCDSLTGSLDLQQITDLKEEYFEDSNMMPSHGYDDSYHDDHRTFSDVSHYGLCSEPYLTDETSQPLSDIGRICALCCCGEKSLLGQGDILRFDPTPGFNPFKKMLPRQRRPTEDGQELQYNERSPRHWTTRRQRGPPKTTRDRSKSPRRTNPHSVVMGEDGKPPVIVDELSRVGHQEEPDLNIVFEPSGHTVAHHCCAAWSEGVCQNENLQLINVDKAVFSGISQRCSYCKKYGATVVCRVHRCAKIYHYPCAASSGAFQEIKDMLLFCPDHLDQAEAHAAEEEANCVVCDSPGDMMEQLFCTSCGQHYHGSCLDPPVDVNPVVRAGWQCPECKICQTCRQPGDDNKMLVCDTCDKGYHTFCLRPVMQTIPKNGWKCKNCRICTDCGSRTPGSGPSSRWHLNYSVCDSCYQQRNKGLCCPICGKAYRQHTAHNAMIQCESCKKWVHVDCDESIDISVYQQLKDDKLTTIYNCVDCRNKDPNQQHEILSDSENLLEITDSNSGYPAANVDTDSNMTETDIISDTQQIDDDPDYIPIGLHMDMPEQSLLPRILDDGMDTESHQSSQDLCGMTNEDSMNSADVDYDPGLRSSAFMQKDLSSSSASLSSLLACNKRIQGMGKPMKRRLGAGRPRKVFSSHGRGIALNKRRRHTAPPGKRGPKPKIRHPGLQPSIQISETKPQDSGNEKNKEEEDTGMHTTVVLFSVKDKFTLTQDMCVSCGSFGRDAEGRLLTCSQCGQCYHPYCVNIKITKVVLSKGWRCLDCTVCEGCGKASDEGRLLLCDDCDISYHTYCLEPPLQNVPKGGWKCKWCVCCTKCGATSPGFNSEWQNNYTQCGPCSSLLTCPVCFKEYKEDELIIQCVQCYRWLHAECDGFHNEDDIERAADQGYHCLLCRPTTEPALKPPPPPPPLPIEESPSPVTQLESSKPSQQYSVEGIYLTESGFNQIKSLSLLPPHRRKQRTRNRFRPGPLSVFKDQVKLSELDQSSEPAARDSDAEQDEEKADGSGGDDNASLTDPSFKKRKRRPYRPGIGGFIVRPRGRGGFLNKLANRKISAILDRQLYNQNSQEGEMGGDEQGHSEQGPDGMGEKKKRKRRKKTQLEHAFPTYLQEAFFGKSLLTSSKHAKGATDLSAEFDITNKEQAALMDTAQPKTLPVPLPVVPTSVAMTTTTTTTDVAQNENVDGNDLGNTDDPLNFLPHDDELFGILSDLNKDTSAIDIGAVTEVATPDTVATRDAARTTSTSDQMAELDVDDIDKIVTEGLAQMDGKEMDEILSGMLSPHEQTNTQTHLHPEGGEIPFSIGENAVVSTSTTVVTSQTLGPQQRPTPPTTLPLHPSFPPQQPPPPPPHPHHHMGMGNPVFSPDFTPPQSPWPTPPVSEPDVETLTYNQRNVLKWEKDEPLGEMATISAVLYANINYPDLHKEYPDWTSRAKQIAKIWRKASTDERAPFLQRARENRAAQRLKEAQKVWKIKDLQSPSRVSVAVIV